jgi:hypothetical protein
VRPAGSALPALVLQVISDPRPQHLKGFNARRQSRVQVSCLAADRATVRGLREAAIAALVAAGDFYGVRFGRALIPNLGDRGGDAPSGTGFVHRDLVDLLIWHD